LQRELRGDLDSIALKALENDRARRYATPSEFAADIGKYLRNEPVSAHAPSAAYQARKYLRRHWAGAAVAAVVLALLVGFAVTQSIQLREIRLGRDRADQITGFMKQIFKVADPSEARGNSVTAREILDRSSRQIESGVGLDAGEQSELLQVMAETYQNLGLYARAHTLAQAALDSRRRLFGPEDPKTLQSLAQMGNLLFLEGHAAEAEASLRDTVAIELRVLGAQNILTLQTQDALVSNLAAKGRYAEAEKLARQTIALESVTLGPRNLLTLNTTRVLASALRSQNRFAEAEALFRQTALIEQQVLGADHPDTLKTRSSLANLLRLQGRYSEAEDILKDVLASRRRVLGEDHPETADTLTMLAIDLVHDRNRYKEAEELYRTALAIDLRQLGPESRFTTRTEEGLANVLAEQDRYGEAEPLFREVLRVRLKLLGPDATDTLLTERNLGNLMLAEGHLPEAERIFRSTLERDERVLAPDDRDLLGVKSWLAETLLQEHRPAEAEVFARQAFEAEQRVLGAENATTLDGLYRLAHALAALGRYDEAKSLYMGAIDKIASEPKSSPSKAWYDFACLAAMTGHVDDALEGLQHAAALGYKNGDSTDHDENLNPLRRDARFASLIDRIQGSAGSGLPPH
jgi:tetratricopeptide (TPR) repeat protein